MGWSQGVRSKFKVGGHRFWHFPPEKYFLPPHFSAAPPPPVWGAQRTPGWAQICRRHSQKYHEHDHLTRGSLYASIRDILNAQLTALIFVTSKQNRRWIEHATNYTIKPPADLSKIIFTLSWLCVFGRLCVDIWRLVHQWSFLLLWLFLTSRLYQQCTNRQKTVKPQKWPLVYQSSHVYTESAETQSPCR